MKNTGHDLSKDYNFHMEYLSTCRRAVLFERQNVRLHGLNIKTVHSNMEHTNFLSVLFYSIFLRLFQSSLCRPTHAYRNARGTVCAALQSRMYGNNSFWVWVHTLAKALTWCHSLHAMNFRSINATQNLKWMKFSSAHLFILQVKVFKLCAGVNNKCILHNFDEETSWATFRGSTIIL